MMFADLRVKCHAALEAGHGFVALLSSEAIDAEDNDILTHSDWQRAGRYRREIDRKNFVLGRAAVRALIMGGDAGEPIRFGLRGKPYVTGGPVFNLSHSGRVVALAIGTAEPVGIDIEVIKWFEPGLLDVVCNDAEKRWILSQHTTAAFYRCWTRKEAVLKAAGLGLVSDLSKIGSSMAVNSPVVELPVKARLHELSRYLAGPYAVCAAFPPSTRKICVAVQPSRGHCRFERVRLTSLDADRRQGSQNGSRPCLSPRFNSQCTQAVSWECQNGR
jgi:4'-phosphopantetheinyl transferase